MVFYSLIGNDVCNEHADTIEHMTTPEQFYNNTLSTLRFLESKLPPGSHVILIGLIDGSIIYGMNMSIKKHPTQSYLLGYSTKDAMAHRLHPLGYLNHDLRYSDVYRWFNCMEIGPCHGWMTSNSTLRQITTRHARMLTRILQARRGPFR